MFSRVSRKTLSHIAYENKLVCLDCILEKMRKQERAASVLREWVNKQGHDRCWYYPEIFSKLCEILEVVPDSLPCLPERSEFEEGCRRYQDEQYGA